MSVRAIRDLERGQVEHPRRTTVALLADALRLNDTDHEAFDNAAAGSPSRADQHAGTARTPRELRRANCRRMSRTSPGANSLWSGYTRGCGLSNAALPQW
jgi:hypothetical protein